MIAQKNPTTQSARVTPLAKTLRGSPLVAQIQVSAASMAVTGPRLTQLPPPQPLCSSRGRCSCCSVCTGGRGPSQVSAPTGVLPGPTMLTRATLLTGLSPRDPWPAALPWPFPFHTIPEWSSSPRVASPDPEDTHALPASVAAAGGRVPVTGRVEQRGLPAWGSRRKGF